MANLNLTRLLRKVGMANLDPPRLTRKVGMALPDLSHPYLVSIDQTEDTAVVQLLLTRNCSKSCYFFFEFYEVMLDCPWEVKEGKTSEEFRMLLLLCGTSFGGKSFHIKLVLPQAAQLSIHFFVWENQ